MPDEKERIIRRIHRKLGKNSSLYPNRDSKVQDLTGLHQDILLKLQHRLKIKMNPENLPRSVIYAALAQFCFQVSTKRGKQFTSRELYDHLVKAGNIEHMDIDSFRKLLMKLDFVWKKVSPDRVIIVENPSVKFERYQYLTTMKRNRIQRYDDIIFVDEIAYNHDLIMDLDESNELAKQPGILQQRVIHAVGVKTVTCLKEIDDFNPSVFEDWIITELCASLAHPSVIVIRNIDHHNEKVKETPTLYSTIQEITDWLEHHNIYLSSDKELSKYELYKLAEEYTDMETPMYKIDGILKARGHTCLRLPKYVEDFNPATQLLNLMKCNWNMPELIKMKRTNEPELVKTCFMDLVMNTAKSLDRFTINIMTKESMMISFENEIDTHMYESNYTPSELDDSDVPSYSDSESE